MDEKPSYRGDSMAVRVLDATAHGMESFSATPVGPDNERPVYEGVGPSILAHPNSPDQFDEPSIVGPLHDNIEYRGRSQAIHVFGSGGETWPPVDPVPACECPGQTEGIFEDFERTIVDSGFGWGLTTPTGLGPWVKAGPGGSTQNVDGGYGKILQTGEGSGSSFGSVHSRLTAGTDYWSDDFLLLAPFVLHQRPSSLSGQVGTHGLGLRDPVDVGATTSTSVRFIVNNGNVQGADQMIFVPRTGSTITQSRTWEVDTPYYLKWLRSGSTNKLRVWKQSDTEPTTWDISNTGDSPFTADRFVVLQTGPQRTPTGIGPLCPLEWWWGQFFITAICAECDDGSGDPLPPFTPGYLPIFRRQIGDPTTTLDSYICTLESAAMVLDWHTRGAVQVWGGELIPFSGRTEASILGAGTNLGDAKEAWLAGWSQQLSVRSGQTWGSLMDCLAEGRAVILQGDYDQFSAAEKCQVGFVDNHAISVYPYQIGTRLLVGDPICFDFKGIEISSLQAYAEDLGAQVFGAQSPQPILFAVSRPWVP